MIIIKKHDLGTADDTIHDVRPYGRQTLLLQHTILCDYVTMYGLIGYGTTRLYIILTRLDIL